VDRDGPELRPATAGDWPGIWPIWQAVVTAGDTYCWVPDTDEPTARAAWLLPAPAQVFVAATAGRITGTALLKPNQPGLGAHVANAAFMVDPGGRGRGTGRALAAYVLRQARAGGYLAMQFNAVVSTNTGAIALWRSLGFSTVGTVPAGFRHARHGLVDLHIMHRRLD
jgi:L-amino acid N-acyltransferase YncA